MASRLPRPMLVPEADPTPFTIAIVDDDPSIRRLISLVVKRNGFKVVEATTAAEARSVLVQQPWDIAVLDRRLPDDDGMELCRELKANSAFRARFVLMLTGEDDEEDKIAGLDLGADDYMTKPFQPRELAARIRSAKRIVDLQKELIASNERLALLSITDGLTRLYNHRHFQEELSRTFEEALRYTRPVSLALLDIDFFKKINDTYGHGAGDEVLRGVSAMFSSNIRSADLAARYGGEEFAVLMPETELDDAVQFAENIRKHLESGPIDTSAGPVPVTLSIGVASFPHTQVQTPRQLVECADRALYRAKRGGRNQVKAERRHQLARSLGDQAKALAK